MRLSFYLFPAQEILQQYKGDVPFAAWLKNFFRENKKFGSRDRKLIADLCFCYFRLGGAFAQHSMEERLLIGQFLCHRESPFVAALRNEWAEKMTLSPNEKLSFLDPAQVHLLFPFPGKISLQVDAEAFQSSFLQQPDLFLRIRPGKSKAVLQTLQHAGVSYSLEDHCLRLPNSTKVDELLRIDEEVVVQDISSQKVLTPLLPYLHKKMFSAWDCCAASGGKTILLHDTFPKVRLTVSDIRESILVNLRNRLKRAGIPAYRSFVADVSATEFSLPQKFELIICDAPCSGSGTWGRTPEQLVYFREEKIAHYAALQKSIALNAGNSLTQNGFFLYITCSVFEKENEDVVRYLLEKKQWRLLSQEYFQGFAQNGDTLFAALFTTS